MTLTHVAFGPVALRRGNLPIMAARFSAVHTTVVDAPAASHWMQYASHKADQHVMLDITLVCIYAAHGVVARYVFRDAAAEFRLVQTARKTRCNLTIVHTHTSPFSAWAWP